MIVLPLHLLVGQADTAVQGEIPRQIMPVNPIADAVRIHEETQSVLHWIEDPGRFNGIETGTMCTVGGGDAKFHGRRFIPRLPRCDRERTFQQPLFIGTEELLRQIDDNELLLLLSGGLPAR